MNIVDGNNIAVLTLVLETNNTAVLTVVRETTLLPFCLLQGPRLLRCMPNTTNGMGRKDRKTRDMITASSRGMLPVLLLTQLPLYTFTLPLSLPPSTPSPYFISRVFKDDSMSTTTLIGRRVSNKERYLSMLPSDHRHNHQTCHHGTE